MKIKYRNNIMRKTIKNANKRCITNKYNHTQNIKGGVLQDR